MSGEVPKVVLPGQDPGFDVGLDGRRGWRIVAVDFGLNLVMAVTLFTVFVALFFFTIAARVEVSAVRSNTSRVVQELMQDMHDTLPPETKLAVKATLKTHLQTPDLSAEDRQVADANRKLIHNTIRILGIAFGVGAAVILLVWGVMRWRAGRSGVAGRHYPDLAHMLYENLILLGFVALAEVVFLFVIGGQYRSLDANAIRRAFLGTMRDFANSAD